MADSKSTKEKEAEKGRTLYVSAGGFVHTTAQEAISASLGFEQVSNTGAGCSQSPDNVPSGGEKK